MNADNTKKLTFREKKIAIIERLLDCREKYTPREWGILQLHYRCGLSQEEIARILQCTQPTVAYHLRQMRKKALS